MQHAKPTLIRKTGKQRQQTPYVYLSREALDELNWELNKLVTVEYDLVRSRIVIKEIAGDKGEQNTAAITGISTQTAPIST